MLTPTNVHLAGAIIAELGSLLNDPDVFYLDETVDEALRQLQMKIRGAALRAKDALEENYPGIMQEE